MGNVLILAEKPKQAIAYSKVFQKLNENKDIYQLKILYSLMVLLLLGDRAFGGIRTSTSIWRKICTMEYGKFTLNSQNK